MVVALEINQINNGLRRKYYFIWGVSKMLVRIQKYSFFYNCKPFIMTNNIRFKWKNTNILTENWYVRNEPAESILKLHYASNIKQKYNQEREWRKLDFNFNMIVRKNIKIVVIQRYWLEWYLLLRSCYLFKTYLDCNSSSIYCKRLLNKNKKKRKLINKCNLIKMETKYFKT